MGISRREFLWRVGQAGGFGAAFMTMQAMGLMPSPGEPVPVEPGLELSVAPGTGRGVTVAILGAGIAGLVAAYEMKSLGYDCTVLEARERPGGRNWTVRTGDQVILNGEPVQTSAWGTGMYQNFGPARLPSVHRAMLGYCRKLGVAMEVEVNMSRSSFLENSRADGGKPVVQRQVVNDARGHVSELLAKCIRKGALDQEMTKQDRDRMMSFLRVYGPLDKAGKYIGSERAGYASLPAAGNNDGVLSKPIDMHTLLDENFWDGILFADSFDMQATMFQPVGGMDRIPYAFAKTLGETVQYNAPVTEIRKTSKGVRVRYTQAGAEKNLEADYCLCALPLTMLKKLPNDFSAPYKKVIAECVYASAYKVAWESRRFWEQDYNIYGGLEFVNQGCNPVWLPSGGMFTDRGVLVSGYGWESDPWFKRLDIQGKFAASRLTIERLHPGHGKELEMPVWVGWERVPWNLGSWIDAYGPGEDGFGKAGPNYEALIEPDGPVYFIGDHVSHIVGWQEGAALSSLRAVRMLSDRVRAMRA
ncbi:MAG: flavin monoamine oxidase family protein [Terracidiphilus sp.]